jgi:3-deoxy-D-manno-octulosonic-acid transferase
LIDGLRRTMRIPAGWAIAYAFVGATVSGWFFLRSVVTRDPERRIMYRERLGDWEGGDEFGGELPIVWLHAASVGEVGLAGALIHRLRGRVSGFRVLLTCNTASGRAESFRAGADEVRFLPVDFTPVLRRVFRRKQPSLFAFVETEIWPGLLGELATRNIPAAMFNARISAKSFPRYLRVRSLVAPGLGSLVRVCARDSASADRLLALGADPDSTQVSGDAKLDAIAVSDVDATEDLLAGYTGGRAVLLAISTHPGEEEPVLEAYRRLRDAGLDVALVIAPRHPERSAGVRRVAAERWRTCRWSEGPPGKDWEVLIVDTTGDIRGFAKSAAAAFVGGSFVAVGGHNLFEPAAFGIPVAAGTHLDEVSDQAEILVSGGCLEVVADASALATVWRHWIESPAEAARVGAACRRSIATHGGALDRMVDELVSLLRQRGIHAPVD